MKAINLKSIIEIFELSLTPEYTDKQLKIWNSSIKIADLSALKCLISTMNTADVSVLNNFFIGYSIPQIGKEFDLLRFSDKSILNIELKSEITQNIHKQLLKNKYYLTFLNKKLFLYTYVAKENIVYKLNEKQELEQVDIKELIDITIRQTQECIISSNPDNLFKPSNYLISPFNKTTQFINGEYFLTKEQEQLENEFIRDLKNGNKYFIITGGAGSGKTLLTYHIAKKYIEEGLRVAIIHVGNLNFGHIELREEYRWNIEPIKYWKDIFNLDAPNIIIIDEVQRLNNKGQFDELLVEIEKNNITLIMSGDKKQTLANNEGWAIDMGNVKRLELKGKIRTNKELSNFIKILFNLNRKHQIKVSDKNITITFFNNFKEAKRYINSRKNYTYISYTPNTGNYSPCCEVHKYNFSEVGTSHQVIGQEFENVIAIMGKHFYYDENGKLRAYKILHNPYSVLGMFYQQVTRTINQLELVIVENFELYKKIMTIFDEYPSQS